MARENSKKRKPVKQATTGIKRYHKGFSRVNHGNFDVKKVDGRFTKCREKPKRMV